MWQDQFSSEDNQQIYKIDLSKDETEFQNNCTHWKKDYCRNKGVITFLCGMWHIKIELNFWGPRLRSTFSLEEGSLTGIYNYNIPHREKSLKKIINKLDKEAKKIFEEGGGTISNTQINIFLE